MQNGIIGGELCSLGLYDLLCLLGGLSCSVPLLFLSLSPFLSLWPVSSIGLLAVEGAGAQPCPSG